MPADAHRPSIRLPVAELREVAHELAAQRERWEPHVAHDPVRRTFCELARDERLNAWLICWMEGHDTGFHDHDGSGGAVTVLSGRLMEERLRMWSAPTRRPVEAGEGFDFGPADIHRVHHAGGAPAVSLHVYSPPLAAMGAYVVAPEGTLQRHTVPEGEELRPVAA
jgi:predicted metal-dependent enzyme (double-stranded beta helix superfamily)